MERRSATKIHSVKTYNCGHSRGKVIRLFNGTYTCMQIWSLEDILYNVTFWLKVTHLVAFAFAELLTWLDSFMRLCIEQGFWSSSNTPSISATAEDDEDTLFCDYHILQSYLSDRPEVHYNLRERHHNKVLIPKTADLTDRDFLERNVYRGIY